MGIIADLSKYQGAIDFAKLSKVVDGVILRVQYGYTKPDEKYNEYVAGCKANNIMFGTYAYFAAVSVNDAIAEADTAFDRTDKDSKFFLVDIEEKSMSDLVRGGQAYIDRLKARGMKDVGHYSYIGFWNNNNLGDIKSDFQWIASYGVNDGAPHTKPNIDAVDLWQYTSTGKLDGITGNVDLNVVTNHVEFPFFDKPVVVVAPPSIQYQAHVQDIGWQDSVRDGATAGTTGQSLRLEALMIRVDNSNGCLTIEGHVENYGWQAPRTNGEIVGTVGEHLRLEAIKINCDKLNLTYRVHIQDTGWTEWAKNGDVAGTVGQAKRIEAIEIKLG